MATENIPSRLHSVAQGNVVTGANEILDDDNGKKQNVINQENDQRLETLETAVGTGGSVDSRIESAKTEIVGGASSSCNTLGKAEALISTNANDIAVLQEAYAALTQNDVVVVAPAETWPVATPEQNTIYRVVDRVNTPPQYYTDYMWNGTAMVEMAQYNNAIDAVPTAGSHNLVESGGVQNELALGAVYDVSAKNPTAGPNSDGKWESLSALLSDANLNTLIPTSYRKGGMSIKFVQSSDNKYVQARCIADEFTIDVTQWQGVDDEPTAGSNNLVKSGGVYEEINNVETPEISIKLNNYYVKASDGTRDYLSGMCIITPIVVKKGMVVNASIDAVAPFVAPIAFSTTPNTDSDMQATPLVGYSATNNYSVEIENDGYIFISCLKTSTPTVVLSISKFAVLDDKIESTKLDIEGDINTLSTQVDNKIDTLKNGVINKYVVGNLIYKGVKYGKYAYVNSGILTIGSVSSYKYKIFSVVPGTLLRIKNNGTSYSYFAVLCNEDGSNATLIEDAGGNYTVPSGNTLLYVNYQNDNESDIVIQTKNLNGEYDNFNPLIGVPIKDEILNKKSLKNISALVVEGYKNYYINTSGQRIYNSGLSISKPINVKTGDEIVVNVNANADVVCPIAFCPYADVTSASLQVYAVYSSSNVYRINIINDGYIFLSYLSTTSPSVTIERNIEKYDLLSQVSQYFGKNIAFLGDSITEGITSAPSVEGDYTSNPVLGLATYPFHRICCDILGANSINYGISGTTISQTTNQTSLRPQAFTNRYDKISTDVDMVVVCGGTNDYGTQVPMGTPVDTTDISFYGALDVLCRGLIERFNGKRIVFVTPIKRTVEGALEVGLEPLQSYRDAIVEIASLRYGLDVIDGTMLGFSSTVTDFKNLYIYDGLHPTVEGHKIYGKNLALKMGF